MSKIKLHCADNFNSFMPYYFEKFMWQFFDFEPLDDTQTCTNIVINCFNYRQLEKLRPNLESCKSIILDNLQEIYDSNYCNLDCLEPYKEKILMLTIDANEHPWLNIVKVPNWFWYFESPWYYSRQYHLYSPNLSSSPKLFFMPIRRTSIGRELIYEKLQDIIINHHAIYSFVDKGIHLPGIPKDHKEDQRWFDPSWYDNTYFSVVNEDSVDNRPKIFTEKTCKPLAFYHPFILLAQHGVLQIIKEAGFETFPELFDESYDTLLNINDRVNFVNTQIRSFDISHARSNVVTEKLKYNHDRFFDQNLVFDKIKEEVIDPIINFISSK